ncbi:MAG: cell division protein FtsZ [Bdellovibrionales bacterium CG10_big_fil_rev_8_21_14_0_10_45_34]|nr:MAG: cell division protein FtsZ [Bdellovibrionales bacterium CG10_big_fil_rev_8_21_14_0_10_45_34]
MFELEESSSVGANIKVIGVGGAGSNAVSTMITGGLSGVEFLVANTDHQALTGSPAPVKLQLGRELTKGLGAGANPDIGRRAAVESYNDIVAVLEGADMVFVTAGMGGGTGTGGAPVVAKIARELGALTIGVVTKPFLFEGPRKRRHAEAGIQELKENVDTLIVIPNQKLLTISAEKTPFLETLKKANEVLLQAVQGISNLINIRGLINLDFADVRTVMASKGMALMGSGLSSGENRAIEAATNAISSPLLENISIDGATGVIINITGGLSMSLHEVNEAATLITDAAHEDAEIIFGAVIDEEMKDDIRVTVVATGFGFEEKENFKAPYVSSSTQFVTNNKTQQSQAPQMQQFPVGSAQSENIAPVAENASTSVVSASGVDNSVATPAEMQTSAQPQDTVAPGVVAPVEAATQASNLSSVEGGIMSQANEGKIIGEPATHLSPRNASINQEVNLESTNSESAKHKIASEPPHKEESPSVDLNAVNGAEVASEVTKENILPRELLLAKARAYREAQKERVSSVATHHPEQLTMNVESTTNQEGPLEAARRMARDVKAPFDPKSLEVPAYIRRQRDSEVEM